MNEHRNPYPFCGRHWLTDWGHDCPPPPDPPRDAMSDNSEFRDPVYNVGTLQPLLE